MVVLGGQLDLMILEVFSNLNDGMVRLSCSGIQAAKEVPGTSKLAGDRIMEPFPPCLLIQT